MFRRGPLLAQDGAGGGGAANGSGAPGLSQEHWDQIDTRVASVVNAALTARFKTFEKQFGEKLEGSLGSVLEKKLEGFKAQPPADDGTGKGKTGKGDDVEIKTLRAQVEAIKTENEANRKRADEERAKSRNISLRNRLSEELAKHGITEPIKLKHALALLVDSERRVNFEDDESERLVFNNDDGPVDLATGLRSWVKTDDGKHFLPPSGAKGSGSRPGGSAPNGADPAAARAEFFESLGTALRGM